MQGEEHVGVTVVILITVLLVAPSRGNGSIQEEGSLLCSGGPQLTLVLQLEDRKQELRPSGFPPAWGSLNPNRKARSPETRFYTQHSHLFLFPFSRMWYTHVYMHFAYVWAHLGACRSLRLTLGIILDCSL